jgi:hypothetical protein
MAIGEDPFGNSICLGVTGANRGKVYFFEGEGARDDDPEKNRAKLHRVADSFAAFLKLLEED